MKRTGQQIASRFSKTASKKECRHLPDTRTPRLSTAHFYLKITSVAPSQNTGQVQTQETDSTLWGGKRNSQDDKEIVKVTDIRRAWEGVQTPQDYGL